MISLSPLYYISKMSSPVATLSSYAFTIGRSSVMRSTSRSSRCAYTLAHSTALRSPLLAWCPAGPLAA